MKRLKRIVTLWSNSKWLCAFGLFLQIICLITSSSGTIFTLMLVMWTQLTMASDVAEEPIITAAYMQDTIIIPNIL